VLLGFETDVLLPAEQSAVGDVTDSTPFALPHTPLIDLLALQDAVDPPFDPLHVHVQGPVPLTAEAVPTPHNPEDGAV
jgi:hypothetical protein